MLTEVVEQEAVLTLIAARRITRLLLLLLLRQRIQLAARVKH